MSTLQVNPIALLQNAQNGGSGTSLNVTFTNPTENGSSIVFAVAHNSGGAPDIASVTGPPGFTFEFIPGSQATINGRHIELWIARTVPKTSTAPTFTITTNGAAIICGVAMEWSGLDRREGAGLDQIALNTGNGTTLQTATTGFTNASHEQSLVAVVMSGSETPGLWTNGYTGVGGSAGGSGGNRTSIYAVEKHLESPAGQPTQESTSTTIAAAQDFGTVIVTVRAQQGTPIGQDAWAADFNVPDSESLPEPWNETDLGGSGVQVKEENAYAVQVNNSRPSHGVAMHPQKILGTAIAAEWSCATGEGAATSGPQMRIYLRNGSPTGVDPFQHYEFRMTAASNSGELRRNGQLLTTGLALQIPIVTSIGYQKFRWEIRDQPNKVVHDFYIDDVLADTFTDGDTDRLTDRGGLITTGGYAGFYLRANEGVYIGVERALQIDWIRVHSLTSDILAVGRLGIAQSIDGLCAAGTSGWGLLTYDNVLAAGTHHVRVGFDVCAAGLHHVFQSVDGLIGAGRYHLNTLAVDGLLTIGRHNFYVNHDGVIGAGAHRVEGTALYRLWIGVNQEPDVDAPPDDEFTDADLPYVTTATLTDDSNNHILIRRVNIHDLEARNIKSTVIETDAVGDEVPVPPSPPIETSIIPYTAGTLLITAKYMYETDAPEIQADQFAIWTNAGGPPVPSINFETAVIDMEKRDGVARLRYVTVAYNEGQEVGLIVRTRRSTPAIVDSTNTDQYAATATLLGPTKPGGFINPVPGGPGTPINPV